jgi:spore coat protein U-like protein
MMAAPLRRSGLLRWLAALLLALGCGAARADACSVTMSDFSFASVSPISASDYTASATGSVSCTWNLLASVPPFLLLVPSVTVCLNLGVGTLSTATDPRTLGNGSNRLNYNLYASSAYAASGIWGGPATAATPNPLTFTLNAPQLTGGTSSVNFTAYAQIPAGALLASMAQTVGNANTVYSSSFAGAATMKYAFYLLIPPSCQVGFSQAFSFQVQATVVNDCNISVGSLAFANSSLLSSPVRTTANLAIQCVNNNAYQISLSGGSAAGNVAARKMKSLANSETIAYRISNALDGTVWGDGTAGTVTVTGTGNGAVQNLTLYGMVPAQATPSPGDYKDTVTATVAF